LNEGAVFGTAGEGFMRLNAACPRATLLAALEQLAQAVQKHTAH
jgi:cystathionine beta-lyase